MMPLRNTSYIESHPNAACENSWKTFSQRYSLNSDLCFVRSNLSSDFPVQPCLWLRKVFSMCEVVINGGRYAYNGLVARIQHSAKRHLKVVSVLVYIYCITFLS
jgi:hypothetical protein